MHREETAAASAAAAHSTATSGSNAENRSGRDGEPKSAGAAAAAGTTAAKEMMDLDGEWRALDFTVHVSLRYHSKRRGFLENAHRWAMLLAVVSGSAAFVAVFGAETGLAKAATLIVVFATAIDVFFDLPVAAHRHDDLYKRFADVAVMLASAPARDA